MDNKKIGKTILLAGVIMVILVFIFNLAIKEVAKIDCEQNDECVKESTINLQSVILSVVSLIILIVGIIIYFLKRKNK